MGTPKTKVPNLDKRGSTISLIFNCVTTDSVSLSSLARQL